MIPERPPAEFHTAGPIDPDKIQRCARCKLPLKDLRVEGLERLGAAIAWEGPAYPEGARIERGRQYQAMALHHDGPPTTCAAFVGTVRLYVLQNVCECSYQTSLYSAPGSHHARFCPCYRTPTPIVFPELDVAIDRFVEAGTATPRRPATWLANEEEQ